MLDIVLASNNKGKIAELRTIIGCLGYDIRVRSLSDIDFSDDIEENGTSFEENSLIKASCPARRGYIGMADDSGLCVDALGGRPGIYSARYADPSLSGVAADIANRAKLLREMDGLPDDERGAAFVCTVSLVLPEASDLFIPEKYRPSPEIALPSGVKRERCAVVRGEFRGEITTSERGENGFGYDSLFYSHELGMTCAQADADAKNAVSHRGVAMRKFAQLLGELCAAQ